MLQNDVSICELPDLHINEYANFTHLSLVYAIVLQNNVLICNLSDLHINSMQILLI